MLLHLWLLLDRGRLLLLPRGRLLLLHIGPGLLGRIPSTRHGRIWGIEKRTLRCGARHFRVCQVVDAEVPHLSSD